MTNTISKPKRKRCSLCKKLKRVRSFDNGLDRNTATCADCRLEHATCTTLLPSVFPKSGRTECGQKASILTDDGYRCGTHGDDYAQCEGCGKVLPHSEFCDPQGAGRCVDCVKADDAADLARLRAEQAACHKYKSFVEGECKECGRTYYEVQDQTRRHPPEFVYFDGEVYRWATNDRVPPDDCLSRFWINRLPNFSLGEQRRAEDAQRAL